MRLSDTGSTPLQIEVPKVQYNQNRLYKEKLSMRGKSDNLLFPHLYEWEVLDSLPENRNVTNFPNNNKSHSISFVVEVIPSVGDAWIGNFSGSGLGIPSDVFTTPNMEIIGVGADGIVHFVNAKAPSKFDVIPVVPVVKIIPSIANNFLVLVGFTKLALYAQEGLRWISKISADGIAVSEITGEKIKGLTWDPTGGREVDFEINIKSGIKKGGSA